MWPFDPRDPLGFQRLLEESRKLLHDARRQARFIVFMSWLMFAIGLLLMITDGAEKVPFVLIPVGLFYLVVLLAMKPPAKPH
jgi:hypothetical protein